MNFKVLVEDTQLSAQFGTEHGLSLYIETEDNKILFDMGESSLFLKNAKNSVSIFPGSILQSYLTGTTTTGADSAAF